MLAPWRTSVPRTEQRLQLHTIAMHRLVSSLVVQGPCHSNPDISEFPQIFTQFTNEIFRIIFRKIKTIHTHWIFTTDWIEFLFNRLDQPPPAANRKRNNINWIHSTTKNHHFLRETERDGYSSSGKTQRKPRLWWPSFVILFSSRSI